jgi:hypothetical protein
MWRQEIFLRKWIVVIVNETCFKTYEHNNPSHLKPTTKTHTVRLYSSFSMNWRKFLWTTARLKSILKSTPLSTPSTQWWRQYCKQVTYKAIWQFTSLCLAKKMWNYLTPPSPHKFYKNITFFSIMCDDTPNVPVTVVHSNNLICRT